jgi:hypothetical protein
MTRNSSGVPAASDDGHAFFIRGFVHQKAGKNNIEKEVKKK